jgi:hypothetical protein
MIGSNSMKQFGSLRWIGLFLLVGLVTFSVATIIAEPFEQETPESLYAAITSNMAMYQTVNMLATIGLVLVLTGFFLLTFRILPKSRSIAMLCFLLFAAATVFWMAEIFGRLTTTATSAQSAPRVSAQSGIGIGFDFFFLGFFITALVGTTLLVWGLGKAGVLSDRIAAIASLVVLTSGIVAAIFYPWVGGVERVFFYPLVLVVLPLAIYLLLVRRRQPVIGLAG